MQRPNALNKKIENFCIVTQEKDFKIVYIFAKKQKPLKIFIFTQ